jgi:hypothetical protein
LEMAVHCLEILDRIRVAAHTDLQHATAA